MSERRRVGIIGGSGQLGGALAEAFAGCALAVPDRTALDLGDADSIRGTLDSTKPDVVLLAAAMAHVDGCELDAAACARVNVDGTRAVAAWAAQAGATVVFFSSDHVFDGRAEAYGEDDPVHPLNEYARSKVTGERIVREYLPGRHVILRTAWVYGPDRARRNFALRLVTRLRGGQRVPVPSDQSGAPTYTGDLAIATRHLVERRIAGTFHATGPEVLDRVALAHRICARFGVDPAGIVPVPTAELRQPAPRPLRVRLRCERLAAVGAPSFRGVDDGLAALHAWASTHGAA
jgi:dTDP-4-dehydrorhamnose reductase